MNNPDKKRLEFPKYLQPRVADLLLDGLQAAIEKGRLQADSDKKIHDILCDYHDRKRMFNVFDVNDHELDTIIIE